MEWDDLSNITPQERQTMREWHDSFEGKYPIRYADTHTPILAKHIINERPPHSSPTYTQPL